MPSITMPYTSIMGLTIGDIDSLAVSAGCTNETRFLGVFRAFLVSWEFLRETPPGLRLVGSP